MVRGALCELASIAATFRGRQHLASILPMPASRAGDGAELNALRLSP
jgi:hypothetical protein